MPNVLKKRHDSIAENGHWAEPCTKAAARHNVQINLIAQNFVENPVYFPPEFTATDEFRQLLTQVPIGRLATGREDALFALFLASNESDFFVGQSIPFSGGWAQ